MTLLGSAEATPLRRRAAEALYRDQILACPDPAEAQRRYRAACQNDLYFLLTVAMRRFDARHDWIYDRCREVQRRPDNHIDLWARFHYKSSICTVALSIQDLLNDPDHTIGILSYSRPLAKAFLRQIKREFETNRTLKDLFGDILWRDPEREAPAWGDEAGLVLKRPSNPKEASVEAWGLVEGQPVGRHFSRVVYDDVVTRESVTTPEMILKTTESWELSLALIAPENGVRRYVGTRYHHADTYDEIIKRGAATPRIYPAIDDDGVSVLIPQAKLDELRTSMGVGTYAAQMLLNPTADSISGFQLSWLQYYEDPIVAPAPQLNKYILVDPANSKKKDSDWTAAWVVGLGADRNYHICEVVRDRLNLMERVALVMRLHRKWRPLGVGYEQYGLQADIQALEQEQRRINYRFAVTPLGGKLSKKDRIERLSPIFQAHRVWLPATLPVRQYDGKAIDLIAYFIHHEYLPFPASRYYDMLDALARIEDDDLGVIWPQRVEVDRDDYGHRVNRAGEATWMSA